MAALYFLPYSATYPSAGDYKTRLQNTWNGYKLRYIDTYGNGQVHDPSKADDGSTTGFNEAEWAVSEGQGYGMLMAVYMNDQTYFDKILDGAYTYMYNKNGKGLFAWKASKLGVSDPLDNGSATDADIFITLAITYADTLVKTGKWSDTGRDYGGKAQSLINEIWAHDVDSNTYLNPGDSFYGANVMNPSYFFTAALKVFDEYENTHHNWPTVIDQCYTTLQAVHPGGTDGYFFGLSPDWCTRTGGTSFFGVRPPLNNSYVMYYDGIRVPWMASADAIWNSDARAIDYCQKGMNFLSGKYGSSLGAAQNNRMYYMDGTIVSDASYGGHSAVTHSMWSCGSMGSGYSTFKSDFNNEYNNFSANAYSANGYWGWAPQYYYDQSLAMFGALMMGGNFVNVYGDLKGLLPSNTPTQTYTYTSTATITSTQTSAATYSPTATPTRTSTNTPTWTVPPVITYTPTRTATSTAIPSSTITVTSILPTFTPTVAVPTNTPIVPTKIELGQNYPNGFSSSTGTWIPFQLNSNRNIKVTIFSIAGREIKNFDLGEIVSGVYYDKSNAVYWDGKDSTGNICPKGVYLYGMEADGKLVGVKKMIKKD